MKNTRQRAEAHRQAGIKAMQAHAWTQARSEFERATQLAPQDALMWMNLARAHLQTGDLPAATQAAQHALRVNPKDPLACRLVAECLVRANRFEEAAQVFDHFPTDAPRDHDWHNAHGNALFQSRRLQDAVSAFFQALALKIDAPLAHYRLGLCFKDLDMVAEATECFRTVVTLDKGSTRALALSLLVHEGRQSCDWSRVEEDTAALLAALDDTDTSTAQLLSPFALLAVNASPAQQKRIGQLRTHGLAHLAKPLPAPGPRRPGPIRIGYLSSDFHQHATAVLMTELLEHRDRQNFEVWLYSHSVDDGHAITTRVRAACDHFIDVKHALAGEIALRMRADDIDIAIDLKGHTRGSRFELLAYRPARVQVAYLGYPATTGADFIDYIIGDPVVTPLAHAENYTEHIAQLPDSYQPNDRQRALPPAPSRASLGLPSDKVVLCCFNQTYKLSPHMLDLWAKILHQAPNTVLWMLAWNPQARTRLDAELLQRGISKERVFWAPKQNLAEHIARLRAADLFLDTWPCNAHTTASEALWAGVPVLTVPGATYASRVAASLATACGQAELACESEADYVNTAVALAQNLPRLRALQQHLNAERLRLPLFDTHRYVRHYEALLTRMFERQQAGLAPGALKAEVLGRG